ncbi:unnamed protein product [Rhodiola kirilowii]
MLFVEHRYYGDSIPFNSREETFRNASTLGYLNSAQALADIAEIIISVKTNYSAHDAPVIIFGGSYAGNLAAWMRLKYPHLVLGALAFHLLLFSYSTVSHQKMDTLKSSQRDFKEISENCYKSIKKSWDKIDEVALEENGLSALSTQFHTCSPLQRSLDLKTYLEYHYNRAAQYGEFSIEKFCKIVDTERSFCWIVKLAVYVSEITEWYPSDRWQRKLPQTQEIVRKIKTYDLEWKPYCNPCNRLKTTCLMDSSRRALRSMLLMKEYACRLLHLVSLSDS